MNEPNNLISKEAIKNYNEVFAYAKEHYFATDDAAKALMEEQRMTIGLSDEIYKYGDELYPY